MIAEEKNGAYDCTIQQLATKLLFDGMQSIDEILMKSLNKKESTPKNAKENKANSRNIL